MRIVDYMAKRLTAYRGRDGDAATAEALDLANEVYVMVQAMRDYERGAVHDGPFALRRQHPAPIDDTRGDGFQLAEPVTRLPGHRRLRPHGEG